MPQRMQKPCRHKGCNKLHRNANGYCDQHSDDALGWKRSQERKGNVTQRGYGYKWQVLRKRVLERDGYLCQCEECAKKLMPLPAHEVDHIIPKSQGGKDNLDNLRAINRECHKRKTQIESITKIQSVKDVSFYPEWLEPASCNLIIVFGAPASGKSTYVKENANPSDLVIDLDVIQAKITGEDLYKDDSKALAQAIYLRNKMLSTLKSRRVDERVWFISTGKTKSRRNWWMDKLKPSKVIMMNTSKEESIRRIQSDARRSGKANDQIRVVNEYEY